jgi:putative SOS response-associated peptidase YedK
MAKSGIFTHAVHVCALHDIHLILGVSMCGRFTMATNAEALEERFRAHVSTEVAAPTYNAAPSQAQLTILNDHPDAIVRAAWGFVPEWADGRPDVKPLINARAETVATKPFFRDAFKRKRCLVLADGFYEWKRAGKGKVPYRIALKTEEPFAFAGIWSAVHDAQGGVHPTFAILTTEANALVAQIHTRMPVILREQDEADWLNPRLSLDEAQALLVPLPAELLMAYEVSPQVNSPAFNVPEALQPVA